MRDTLSSKQYRFYNYISRYQPFPYYFNNEDNKYVYGLTSNLDNTTPSTTHIVERPEESYDYLAYLYYGDPSKYWVICDFNRVRNPLQKIEVGSKIKIPTLSELKFL